MDDDEVEKKTLLMEEFSKNSFEEAIGSSNLMKCDESKVEDDRIDDTSEDESQHDSNTVDYTSFFVTDKVFESPEAMASWCKEIGKKHKTVIVTSRSVTTMAGKGSIIEFGCERGGVYRSHKKKGYQPTTSSKKKRNCGTKKCGCPFRLVGVWTEGNIWILKVACGLHNHKIANTLIGHAYVARLKDEEKELLTQLTMSGVRPSQILTSIKERNEENYSTMRTIYNEKKKLTSKGREERNATCNELVVSSPLC